MNDIAVAQPGITVTGFDQAMRLAETMANGRLVPVHLQKSPADCLMVIEQAIRWKMSPFAVAQTTSIIGGKLMYEGKLVGAVLFTNGISLKYSFDGQGEGRKITATGCRRGETEEKSVEVALKDVRTPNKAWATQPDQQLVYSANRVWARRHAPELMLGVYVPEEMEGEVATTYVKPSVAALASVTAEQADDAVRQQLIAELETAARTGIGELQGMWKELSKEQRAKVGTDELERLKKLAVDEAPVNGE
jgi:hypothetical protein